MARDVAGELQDLLYDPQTSGGLLFSIDQLQTDLALQLLERAGVPAETCRRGESTWRQTHSG